MSSYDSSGDWMLRVQAQAHSHELSRRVVEIGRRFHRRWVDEVFATQLIGRRDRAELVDLLVVATGLLTWKTLCRDEQHDRATTTRRMHRLVQGVLATARVD